MKVYKQILKYVLNEASYKEFFKKTLKEFGVSSPKDLKGDKKLEFFDYIEKNWTKEK